MNNGGGVFVTTEQIYDEVLGMKDGLGEVKALLEKQIAVSEERSAGIEQRLENHGTRLGDLGTQHVNLEGRVTKVEGELHQITDAKNKKEARQTPWWIYPTVITGIIGGLGGLIGLFITLSDISQALTHLP